MQASVAPVDMPTIIAMVRGEIMLPAFYSENSSNRTDGGPV
jgi:hypothetical protein